MVSVKRVIFWLIVCFRAYAVTPALVGTPQVTSTGSASSLATTGVTHTAGNALFVCMDVANAKYLVKSLVNTAGDKFYLVGDIPFYGPFGSNHLFAYLARNIAGNASDVVTATLAGTATSFITLHVSEWSGVAKALPVDGWGKNSTTTSATVGVNLSTSYANEVLLGCFGNDGNGNASIAPSAGFTTATVDASHFSAVTYDIVSTLQTGTSVAATYASGQNNDVVALALAGAGQNPTYTYVRAIPFDHTKVGTVSNTDQSNFPALINHTEADLATVANGGNIQNISTINGVTVPADYVLSTDSLCANTLDSTGVDFEIESYSATTGSIIAFPSIATLKHAAPNTTIYQCYGSCAVKNSPSNGSAVWTDDGNFAAVFHYSNVQGLCTTISLPMFDSTNSANLPCGNTGGSGGPANNAAQIGKGLDFTVGGINTGFRTSTGVGGLGNVPCPNCPTGASTFTIESWLKVPSGMGVGWAFGWGTNSATGDYASLFWFNNASELFGCNSCNASTPFTADNLWHQWTFTLPGGNNSNNIIAYRDGVAQTTTGSSNTLNFGNTVLEIGALPNSNSNYWLGGIDESRISTVARSADWIVTTYNCGGNICYTLGSVTINGAAICPGITGNQRSFSYVTELFPMEFPWEQTCSKLSDKGAL